MRRLFLIFTFCFLFFSFITPLFAQTPPTQNSVYKKKSDAILKGNNQERWLKESLDSNAVIALEILTGKIPDSVLNGTATSYIPAGMLGFTNQMIASLWTPPASGFQYLAGLKDSFLGKPAYAQQGFGFAGLQPILPIWRGFRNIVYLLSSLVFIIIGVMIMLRVKISPQAVVTVQNAVPQLITTLVLVTFSYAIAGLLIDLMTFVQGVVIALLFEVTGKGLSANLLDGTKNYSFDTLTNAGIGTYADLTFRAIPTTMFMYWGFILGAIIAAMFLVPTGGWSITALGIVPVIVLLVMLILVVIWMFKFYFGCLKAYVTVIFKIVIAPLELAMGAFPNSKMGFSTWIWDLIANLAIFPVSLIFMVVGNMLVDFSKKGMWAPSVISNMSIPTALTSWGLGTANLPSIISVGIGLSVIALVSKLPEMIPEFVFAIKPSPWGKAIGEGTKGAFAPVTGAGRLGAQLASQKQQEYYNDPNNAGNLTTGDKLRNAAGDTAGLFGWVKRK
ncbi:hypothetical protein HYV64_03920 [Candidatus Shapirobacteria bacterium]|nr:hypothetical protein [Candidatus Shapirobacteria bacterium]